jgi:D-alanine-D-alanine ligase
MLKSAERMKPALSQTLRSYKVWVLVPQLETADPHLEYYYDFSQSFQEYTRVFDSLEADWIWQPVQINNIEETIRTVKEKSGAKKPLVINLCDGDEMNGTPGISVIHALEKERISYTGSDACFYEITTSKIPMKEAFDKAGVPTAEWAVIDVHTDDWEKACENVPMPLIIKPAISGGSMGVSVKNVVHDNKQLIDRIREIKQGYRGWQLDAGGIFAEKFIEGPEFTTLVVGDGSSPDTCKVYEPVERVFHPSLPETEKFLSFDRLWEIYEEESPMPNNENFYSYISVEEPLCTSLKEISLQAYAAVGGKGYGRIDIRMDRHTGELSILEVNAQCGLSEDEDYTSIGAILRVSEVSFAELIGSILKEGMRKNLHF